MQFLSSPQQVNVRDVIALRGGTARTRDILAAGVHPRRLYAERDAGTIVEVSRGVFALAEAPPAEPDLVAVAARMPRAVLGLVSALHLHGLTTEIPRAVHVLLPRGVHAARIDGLPLEVYHCAAANLAIGVEERSFAGVKLRVTTPAKSVADAFKFRSRVGLEAAIDALKAALRAKAATAAEIDRMARVDRVQAIVRPYLEALA
jgi:predicted transcriptional regulator of viral defense system